MKPEKEMLILKKRIVELEIQVETIMKFLKESIEIRLQPIMTETEEYINRMLP